VTNHSVDLNDHAKDCQPSQVVHVHFTRRMLFFLAIILICPCVIVTIALSFALVRQTTNKPFTPHSDEKNLTQIKECKPGPWGRLLYAQVIIDIPDEFIILPGSNMPPVRWFFQDYDKNKIIDLFKSTGISQTQIDKWLPDSAWETVVNGTWVTAGDDMILGLNPTARSKIYHILNTFPENIEIMHPEWFQPQTLDMRIKESGLSESTIKLFKSLLYQYDSMFLLFADRTTVLRKISDENEKRLFMKMLFRQTTLLARLKIDADTDAEAMTDYWGIGGRRKDIFPLINSLKRVEGGWNLDIVHLLPQFIRAHLYTYPLPASDPEESKQDCFWSALNTFNLKIDDNLSDPAYLYQVLSKDYAGITQPSKLGDLIVVTDANNKPIHVAIFIADDIVFTKNGPHHTHPWILMHLNDMIANYAVIQPPNEQLNVHYFRRKEFY
jgi:hypothetical protein